MLTIIKGPEVLDAYGVVGFDVDLAIGDVGSMAIQLNPRHGTTEADLRVFGNLQGMLSEEVQCDYEDWLFIGRICEVAYDGVGDRVRITLEDGLAKLARTHRSQVFAGESLGDVISSLLPSGQACEVGPGFDSREVDLAIQYQESDLAFLRRLIARNAGDIWCAGDTIHVGAAEDDSQEQLTLDSDIMGFTITARLGPEQVEAKSIAYKTGALARSSVELSSRSCGDVQDAVIETRRASKSETVLHTIAEDPGDAASELGALRFLKAYASGRLSVTGRLNRPIHVGTRVRIADREGNSESFVVRSFSGIWRLDGADVFAFEASAPDAVIPEAGKPALGLHASTARVEETDDNMNRVRVSFPWDPNENVTPWLRITSLYWGEKHMLYVPPRRGDTVLVAWGQDDLDPIVLGSVCDGHTVDESSDTFVIKCADGRLISFGKNDIRIVDGADGGKSFIELLPDKVTISSDKVEIKSQDLGIESGKVQIESDKVEIESDKVEMKTPKLDVK